MEKLRRVPLSYALEVDGTEAKKVKNTVANSSVLRKRKAQATGYLVKYVSKNIDGFGMTASFQTRQTSGEKRMPLVGAWSSVWCIRQFQQLGNIPISLWRELRRLGSVEQEDETSEKPV